MAPTDNTSVPDSGYNCQQTPRYSYGRNRKSGAEPVPKNTAGELKYRVASGKSRKYHPQLIFVHAKVVHHRLTDDGQICT
jgi:hypothetical protein